MRICITCIKNQKGQIIVEQVLLVFIVLSIVLAISKGFKDISPLEGLIKAPWRYLASMIEGGNWSAKVDNDQHPNSYLRHSTYRGTDYQIPNGP